MTPSFSSPYHSVSIVTFPLFQDTTMLYFLWNTGSSARW
jgi:hypothetical protein